MGRLNDISLVTQVVVFHNRYAFDQLVREYQSPIRRFFMGQTLGDGALSDDLAQETFIKAYTHITQYRGTAKFLTWLMRIACHVWYDYLRSRKNTVDLDGSAVLMRTSSSVSLLKDDLYQAFSLLKEEERTCISLQMIDGYAIDEIAAMMSMPQGTVKSHLKRGKEKMANYLRNNGYDR